MPAFRIIPVLCLHNNRLTKTVKFQLQSSGLRRDVGHPAKQAAIYDAQLADEMVLLDIRATKEGRGIKDLLKWLPEIANEISIPLTVGGGVSTVEDVKLLIREGAEKVAIGYHSQMQSILYKASQEVGNQSIVAALDVRRMAGFGYKITTHSGSCLYWGVDVVSLAKVIEASGAGEILLTSIDCEGTMKGYDLELTKMISEAVNVPVVANGGCGRMQDIKEVMEAGASGAGISSLWSFSDLSPIKVRAYLEREGIEVR